MSPSTIVCSLSCPYRDAVALRCLRRPELTSCPAHPDSGKKKDKDGQIVIPKRGEKDFEPLERGANVQERALREGREAMFGALEGLRGGNLSVDSRCPCSQTRR